MYFFICRGVGEEKRLKEGVIEIVKVERKRETDRPTDRQTERQRDKEIDTRVDLRDACRDTHTKRIHRRVNYSGRRWINSAGGSKSDQKSRDADNQSG